MNRVQMESLVNNLSPGARVLRDESVTSGGEESSTHDAPRLSDKY